MSKLIYAAMLALALGACASAPPEARVAMSCQGYASTLSTLAEMRAAGELNEEQVTQVNSIRMIVGPICRSADDEAVGQDQVLTLADALRDLSQIRAEVEQ